MDVARRLQHDLPAGGEALLARDGPRGAVEILDDAEIDAIVTFLGTLTDARLPGAR
jgi:hypothetical protein